ncbi:FG-GAP repeat protein [Planctomycetes bacterium Pla163]|uniref:FG-GAP repeat protein n=1 Tax=Rohdeia mirabilis TaxID=2528008 RepID=A0A518CWE2_9BACT|nr:FG-GAP repeat protein [Planctomycetes bacterium Pla163]
MNRPIRQTLPAALLCTAVLGSTALMTSCSNGAATSRPVEPVAGLIASRSGSAAAPCYFVILRPGAEGESWTQERIDGPTGPAQLWLGELEDGTTVWRSIDPAVAPIDTPLKLVAERDGWSVEPWEGITLEDVTWQTKKDFKTGEDGPNLKDYELRSGNAMHKAMWFEPAFGEPGILTISGNAPMLKIWRKDGTSWKSEVLWTEVVGDDEQRLRDIEVGDVDGDGQDELVIVTHNRGGVYVLEQTEGGMVATRVASTDEPIFVHEVEIGQADDDPALEFFTTPSEPNMFNGEDQAGRIDRFDYVDGQYVQSVVEDDPASHAKEILAVDMDGDGRVEIYAALEAKELRRDFTSDYPGYLNSYTFDASGKVTRAQVMDLKGAMCRFLDVGDIDGDGKQQIVAATSRDGIYSFDRDGAGEWTRRKVAGGFRSSGFEHAMVLADIDGDGIEEVIAGSDTELQVQAFAWEAERSRWIPRKLCDVTDGLYLTWNIMPLPAGH